MKVLMPHLKHYKGAIVGGHDRYHSFRTGLTLAAFAFKKYPAGPAGESTTDGLA